MKQFLKGSRIRRLSIVLGIFLLIMLLAASAGYLYLRHSHWWVGITLFDDEHRVENFRRMHELFPANEIPAGGEVWEFERDPQPLPAKYEFAGQKKSVEAFLEKTWTTGLLVSKNGTLLHESYHLGNSQESLATSFSVAKSFVSALVGVAIAEGYIDSVQDPVCKYVQVLQESGYAGVPIYDVLTMSSGVDFDEDYQSIFSDVNMLGIRTFGFGQSLPNILAELESKRDPGTYNEYISSDSLVLGLLVLEATGRSVSEYLSQKIWIPAGMEYDGAWNTDHHGHEQTHAFLGAALRDYARMGRLYLNEGFRDDQEIVPQKWVKASVNPRELHLQPGLNPDSCNVFGYGYQWWLPVDPQGDFLAMGIWGQYIYVHPGYDMVIVKTSANEKSTVSTRESIAVLRTIARETGY